MAQETDENPGQTSEASRAAKAAQAPPGRSGPTGPPAEVLAPKERRRRARAAKASKTKSRGSRSPQERQAERVAERRGKAKVRSVMRTRARDKARAGTTGSETTPPREHAPGVQKVRQGVVVSDRADKTITVRIDTARRHRRYEKIVRTSSTLHAHDESNDAHIGDTVIVREARPLSRTKRWRLIEVVKRAK
jgi:small subunit ribosomal protein S17